MELNKLWLLTMACIAIAQSATVAAELDELQGKWELQFQQQGRALRAVKIIEGDLETVETYDGDKLVHRHVVKLESAETNGITIIKYGEPEVTHGPRKGQKGQPGSFLSKRHGNKWYNIQGIETKSNAPVMVMEFVRVEGSPPEPNGPDKK